MQVIPRVRDDLLVEHLDDTVLGPVVEVRRFLQRGNPRRREWGGAVSPEVSLTSNGWPADYLRSVPCSGMQVVSSVVFLNFRCLPHPDY